MLRCSLTESVIGLFKAEIIRCGRPWRSLEDIEFATLEWVWGFNYRRLLGPIGHVPPAGYEEDYFRAQEAPTGALRLN